MALRKHVADLERAKEASSTAANEVSAELMALRKHVEDLERNKEASSTAVSSREEAMEQELRALRDQMAQNDDQIASMEDQLQSFDKDLDQSKQESNTKQDIIDELATEVEKLKSLASESSTLKLLEDNNMMQMQLVSLAQAFERSENSRAEVLEKVETERQAHAESLRRMTVNMKRFYATMRMSDI
jgi:chromosome segregation ATPase